jgi:hypothetical protein
LNVLRNDESAGFSQVSTGGEPWFSYHYQSTFDDVKSRVAVSPRTKTTIPIRKTLVTISLTGTKLQALDVIPRNKKVNQNCALVILIPELSRLNTNARCRVGNNLLLVSIDSSMRHIHTTVRSISTESQRGEFLILFILRNSHRMTSGSSSTQKSKWKIKSSRTRSTRKQAETRPGRR